MTLRVALDARALDLGYLRAQGIGRYTASLVDALAPVAAQHGGELVVMRAGAGTGSAFGPDGQAARTSTLHLRRPPLPERLAVVLEQLLLPRDLLRARADVLHAPSIFRAVLAPGLPSVVTVYDVIPLLFPGDYLRTGLLYRVLFTAAKRATVILAVSQRAKADIVAQLGVAAGSVEVVPGAAHQRFCPTPAGELLARLRIATPYVLYVGGLAEKDPRKGVDQLIDAFAAWVRARGRSETLVLAGALGPAAEPLRERARRTDARIEFTGFIPEDDLPALYSGSRCLVTASRYEGFGLPALEALACGTPVVAYSVGALPEVTGTGALLVRDGDTDALVRSLERLCDDPQLRAGMAAAGREHAATFSWQRAAQLTWRAYERAARDYRGTRFRPSRYEMP